VSTIELTIEIEMGSGVSFFLALPLVPPRPRFRVGLDRAISWFFTARGPVGVLVHVGWDERAGYSERRRLFYGEGFSAFSPSWSPGGDQIAFSVGRYFRAPGHPAAPVAIVRADGTGLRMVADDVPTN
jgi:hypothetical protein